MERTREFFPDISDILQRKAEGRREAEKPTLGQKIAKIEAMRARLEPFKRAREKIEWPSARPLHAAAGCSSNGSSAFAMSLL